MNFFLILAGILWLYMSFWFVLSWYKKRNDVADVAWGLGFILLSWSAYLLSDDRSVRGILVAMLVTLWGARLAWHIHIRNRGKTEDYRYAKWRLEWGKWFYLRSYFQVYLLQGVFLFLIVLPVLLIQRHSGSALGILDMVGLIIWATGFFFESVGDKQLAVFLSDPANKGRLMQSGLWRYTRHPNYFGEMTQWWGIFLLALSVPQGLLGILGPITISFLLIKVSGIPLLEAKMAENKEFALYKQRTSMLFPWPPRKVE